MAEAHRGSAGGGHSGVEGDAGKKVVSPQHAVSILPTIA